MPLQLSWSILQPCLHQKLWYWLSMMAAALLVESVMMRRPMLIEI
jgi:hypothetical protein